jgi:hypothetical protein
MFVAQSKFGAATSEGADMQAGHDIDEDTAMDLQDAAAIMRKTRERADRELEVRNPVLFASAGLVLLLGYGAIWLSVRHQRPYQGPTGTAIAVLLVLVVAAVMTTASVVDRAASGVSGSSALRRRIGFSSIGIGYIGVLALEAALAHAGASHAVAYGVFAAAAPILVTGAIYIANSAISLDWPLFGLGIVLVAVAASGAFAGPRTVWAVGALAGGSAFIAKAAVQRWLRPR